MKTRKHALTTILPLIFLGPIAVGCAAEEPEDKPYVPQITHSPHELADNENADDGEDIEPEPAEDRQAGGYELEPPEIPDVIYENTLEGAEAAARYYFRAYEYGYAALDAAPLENVCIEDSETCTGNIELIKELARDQKTVKGGAIATEDTTELIGNEKEAVVSFPITQDEYTVFTKHGEEFSRGGGKRILAQFLVRYIDDQWQVRAMAQDPLDK